ncbi:MAG: PxKF domain-containing protein [Candidatus Paceibacterota bacterium]
MNRKIVIILTVFFLFGFAGNSKAATNVGGDIASNTTWSLAGSPYVVNGTLNVRGSAVLNIEPGAVIKFSSPESALEVWGALNAIGTPEKKIIFTSIKDDTYGGDTNNDGNATSPAPGDWGYIRVTGEQSPYHYPGVGNFDNVVVRYGGANTSYPGNVYGYRPVTFSFKNSTSEYSSSNGVYVYAGNPEISGNAFNNNINGFSASGGLPSVTNNTFNNNTDYASYLSGVAISSYSGNSGSGNGKNGLGVSGTVYSPRTWGATTAFPYIILDGGISIHYASGSNLMLEPGAVIKFSSPESALEVWGALNAIGTPEKKIIFTSIKDDTYGGDTNNDGNATSPAPGDWGYIRVTGEQSPYHYPGVGNFDNVVVRYGGANTSYPGNVYGYRPVTFSFKNSTSEYSSSNGMGFYMVAGKEIIGNTFNSNQTGIELYYSSGNQFYYNNFVDNTNNVYETGSGNMWDNGTKGNYYSIFDEESEGCSDVDNNGICDAPYSIPSGIDHYPLTTLYGTTSQSPALTVGAGAVSDEIKNAFITAYVRNGGEAFLGKPISTVGVHNSGYYTQEFPGVSGAMGGVIMYNPEESIKAAFYIHGLIWIKYNDLSDKSLLGAVTEDERDAAVSPAGTVGKYSKFDKGTIYYIDLVNVLHPKPNQALIVYDAIDDLHASMGGTNSFLGFPIIDQEERDGRGYAEFEGGHIGWDGSKYRIYFTPEIFVANTEADEEKYITETGKQVNFSTDPYIGFGNGMTYEWDFGDGIKVQGKNVSHNFSQMGEYNVRLVVKNDAGDLSETESIRILAVREIIKFRIIPANFPDGSLPEISPVEIDELMKGVQDYYLETSYKTLFIDYTSEDSIDLPNAVSHYGKIPDDDGTLIIEASDKILESGRPKDRSTILILNNSITRAFTSEAAIFNDPFAPYIVIDGNDIAGTIAHEIGHSLGYLSRYSQTYKDSQSRTALLPDFYGDKSSKGNIYWWGLMGSGNEVKPIVHFSSFTKMLLGWLEAHQIDYGTIQLEPLEKSMFGGRAYIFQINNKLSYIVEARDLPENNKVLSLNNVTLEDGVAIYKVENIDFFNGSLNDWENWKMNFILRNEGASLNILPMDDPTLSFTVPNSTEYIDILHLVKFRLSSVSTDPIYTPTIAIEVPVMEAADLKGAAIQDIKNRIQQDIIPWYWLQESDGNPTYPDLDLHAYSSDGKHIGMNYETGIYENEILGSYASGDLNGGEEWIFVPKDIQVTYQVSSFDVQKYLEENPDVDPADVTIEYSASSIEYGENPGVVDLPDGTQLITGRTVIESHGLSIGSGETKLVDVEKPTTTVSMSGTPGNNDWYTSDVRVSLSAVDNGGGSGVKAIEYSFDNVIWNVYSMPFSLADEGIKTLYYRSSDNAGNIEEFQTIEIKIDKTAPVITGVATILPNDKGWYSTAITIHFDSYDLGSGIDTATVDTVISTEGADQFVSGIATDKAGNSSGYTVSGINVDKTKPTLNATRTPEPNSDGWNNVDVTVHFDCNDANSGVELVSEDKIINTEGSLQSEEGTCLDVAGNFSKIVVDDLNIDKTLPLITGVATTLPNENGWYNDNVTLHFEGSDLLSGISTMTPDTLISTQGDGQSITGVVVDMAGNSSSYTVSGINIDKAMPQISINSPQDQAVYIVNQNVVADWYSLDSLSGLDSVIGTYPRGAIIDTSSVGLKTFTVTSKDKAGNILMKTITYYVQYRFGGVLNPMRQDGSSVFKLGSAVPVKFELKDINNNYIRDAKAYLYVIKVSNVVAGTEEAVSVGEANDGNQFRYDSVSNQYIFNLATKLLSVGTWQIGIKMDDGTFKYLNIGLK